MLGNSVTTYDRSSNQVLKKRALIYVDFRLEQKPAAVVVLAYS